MSATDKMCGVCDTYQDLVETGATQFFKYLGGSEPIYKRFWLGNVCEACKEKKALSTISINDLTLHIRYSNPKNITKGKTVFINPDNDKKWLCPNNRLSENERDLCAVPLVFSKQSPIYYEVTGKNINHDGLFSYGGIFSEDKRQMRKILRALGVRGKINQFI
jgi:hypothetical protein